MCGLKSENPCCPRRSSSTNSTIFLVVVVFPLSQSLSSDPSHIWSLSNSADPFDGIRSWRNFCIRVVQCALVLTKSKRRRRLAAVLLTRLEILRPSYVY